MIDPQSDEVSDELILQIKDLVMVTQDVVLFYVSSDAVTVGDRNTTGCMTCSIMLTTNIRCEK